MQKALKITHSDVGKGSSRKYGSCMACSDVIRRIGSIVSSFCSWKGLHKLTAEFMWTDIWDLQFYSPTYQVECLAVRFDFMFLHILYKAAASVSTAKGTNAIRLKTSVNEKHY